jgi:hypothetical protein
VGRMDERHIERSLKEVDGLRQHSEGYVICWSLALSPYQDTLLFGNACIGYVGVLS